MSKKKFLFYYSEIIDDRIESGVIEEEAVAEMESIPVIAERILTEVSTINKPKTKRHPLVTILIIISSPLWISFIVVWVVMLFLLSVASVISFSMFFAFIFHNQLVAFIFLGIGFICTALLIFLFVSTLELKKWLIKSIQYIQQYIELEIIKRNGIIK